jgi:hypothetical protein
MLYSMEIPQIIQAQAPAKIQAQVLVIKKN